MCHRNLALAVHCSLTLPVIFDLRCISSDSRALQSVLVMCLAFFMEYFVVLDSWWSHCSTSAVSNTSEFFYILLCLVKAPHAQMFMFVRPQSWRKERLIKGILKRNGKKWNENIRRTNSWSVSDFPLSLVYLCVLHIAMSCHINWNWTHSWPW